MLCLTEPVVPFSRYIQGVPGEEELLRLAIDLCCAAELCEGCDVVHNHICADSVYVSPLGIYKLGGFSHAVDGKRDTPPRRHTGCPDYIAPELYNDGAMPSAKSDIYSIGILLYKFLNDGAAPFLEAGSIPDKTRYTQAFERRMAGAPLQRPRKAGDGIWEILERACAFDPAERYSSASEMRGELTDYLKAFLAATHGGSVPRIITKNGTPVRGGDMRPVPLKRNDPVPTDENGDPDWKSGSTHQYIPPKKDEIDTSTFMGKVKFYLSMAFNKKTAPYIITGAAAAVIITVVIVLCVTFSPTNRIMRYYSGQQYDRMAALYSEKVDGNEKKEAKLADKFTDVLDKLRDDYKSGSVSYSEAHDRLAVIGALGIDALSDKYTEVSDYIEGLYASKTAFETAEGCRATGSYAEAIKNYRLVIEDDTNYADATTALSEIIPLYREKLFASSDALIADGEFAEAITALEDALEVLPDDTDITTKLEDYKTQLLANENDKYLSAAKKAAESGDYLTAMTTMAKAVKSDPSNKIYAEAYTLYIDEYEKDVLESAKALADYESYGEAYKVLKGAAENLDDKTKVESKAEEYKTKCIKKTLENAATFAALGDFTNAKKTIETAVSQIGTQTAFTSALENYSSKEKDTTIGAEITKAKDIAATGDYPGAIRIIDAAIQKYGETDELKTARSTYAAGYVESVTMTANELVREGKYDEAADLVDTALTVLPGNAELTELSSSINEKSKPVSLYSVRMTQSKSWMWNSGNAVDASGVSYPDYDYVILPSGGYGMFALSDSYMTFSGTAAITGAGTAVVTVSDSKTNAELAKINLSSDTVSKNILCSVSSSEGMLITVETTGGASVIISVPELHK